MKGEDAAREPSSARALRDAMSEISERCWCAGWMRNVELFLWAMLEGAPRDYGLGTVTEQELANLRHLSERAGGWCRWSDEDADETFDEDADETFVAIDSWQRIFEASLPRLREEVDRTGVAADSDDEDTLQRWRSFLHDRGVQPR
jgi:hypothetical protein